jgi:hypothetical protein
VLIEILAVPPCRHSGGEQGLDFGGQIERFVVDGIVERFDPESVAGG